MNPTPNIVPANVKPFNVAKEIERRNLIFKKATKAEKRVLVAKDVIAQIKLKRFRPATGVFVQFKIDGTYPKVTDDRPLQTAFLDNTIQNCSVCALGGMFVSCTLFNNKTPINANMDVGDLIEYNSQNGEKIDNGLDTIFSASQLKKIEQAFEGGVGYFRGDSYERNSYRLSDGKYNTYVDKYPDDGERMIALMKNIIKNKGTFIPEKFPLKK